VHEGSVRIAPDVPLFPEERVLLTTALQSEHVRAAVCGVGACEVRDEDAVTSVRVDDRRVGELAAWLDAARELPHAVRPRETPMASPPPRGPCRDRESVGRGDEGVSVESFGAWDDDPACTPIASALRPAADALLACREEQPVIVEIQRDGQRGRCQGACTCAALSSVAFALGSGARRLVLSFGGILHVR
jgi:hypothetical protein